MRRSAVSVGKLVCLALACCYAFGMAGATIGSDGSFRLLKLDGYHVKWGENTLGAGATVSYAFVDVPMRFDGARNCRELVPMTDLATRNGISETTLRAETAAAFGAWEEAANITFIPVDDPDQADILIGAQGRPIGRAFANVMYRPGSNDGIRVIDSALVCLNPDQRWKVGFDGDIDVYDMRYTLVHEIGHAIGLDHPGPSGQIMSFGYSENYSGLQTGDFHGVQLLYGAGMRNMTAGGGQSPPPQEPTPENTGRLTFLP
ncbi:MAG: matrixin family metalloprotease [Gammaproteobacteria bacterium]